MKKKLSAILFTLVPVVCLAQIRLSDHNGEILPHITVNDIDTADIDLDGITDTLFFDPSINKLVCLLSGRDFDPLYVDYAPEDGYTTIGADNGGLYIYETHMRCSFGYGYLYENETGRFRMSSYSGEFFGNAFNDGSGNFSLDLETGTLTAHWNYWDYERDELMPMHDIEETISNPPIYLDGGPSVDAGEDLYSVYRLRSTAVYRIEDIPETFFGSKNVNELPLPDYNEGLPPESVLSRLGKAMEYDSDLRFVLAGDQSEENNDGSLCRIAALERSIMRSVYLFGFDVQHCGKAYVFYYRDNTDESRDALIYIAEDGKHKVNMASREGKFQELTDPQDREDYRNRFTILGVYISELLP